MSRLSIATIERYTKDFRVNYIDTDLDSPINIKTVLTKLGVLALFRPLSEGLCGLSIKSTTDDRFMLINSNNNIGRQHFTVAHELYHLYYGTNTVPHICRLGGKEPEEVNADSFASALLMPEKGLIQQLPGEEYRSGKISMATLLRTERVFGVSHDALLIRLLKLHIINDATYQQFKSITITSEAARYGYDTSLYRPGNNGLYIGTLGEMAKKEFDRGKISEGHYLEILNMLPNERQEA
jgi:Zn-dependent peptidase ImmA (M78 family)